MNLSKRIWSNERRNKKFKNLIKFWSIYKTISKTIVSLFVEKIRKLNPKVTKKNKNGQIMLLSKCAVRESKNSVKEQEEQEIYYRTRSWWIIN